jgi:hypothetical protein
MNAVVKKIERFTPEWWDARKKIEEQIFTESRKRGTRFTEAEYQRSENARLCSLGDDEACLGYERNGFTREQWLAKWNPTGKRSGHIPTDFGR